MVKTLSVAEHDMQKYAITKAYKLMQDVKQFADVAELTNDDALTCLGVTFLRLAAAVAVQQNAPRGAWIRMCGDVFDKCCSIDRTAKEP
jgi:hypothetical protein